MKRYSFWGTEYVKAADFDEVLEALRRATAFLDDNYSVGDMPDILPLCRAALAKVQS